MGTGRAELDTTTTTVGAAGEVASVVDSHVRGLPSSVRADADEVPVVRGWTVTGGTAAEVLRVATDVRRVLADATEVADHAESYAQLQGIGHALRVAGFVVDEVLDGWRTVAVDVAVAAADAEVPADAPKQEKQEKQEKSKKAKKVKPPKAPKQAKAGRAKAAGVVESDVTDQPGAGDADSQSATDSATEATGQGSAAVAGPGESSASAPTPKKSRGGLLRRRSSPPINELVDESGAVEAGAASEDAASEDAASEDADKDLATAAA